MAISRRRNHGYFNIANYMECNTLLMFYSQRLSGNHLYLKNVVKWKVFTPIKEVKRITK